MQSCHPEERPLWGLPASREPGRWMRRTFLREWRNEVSHKTRITGSCASQARPCMENRRCPTRQDAASLRIKDENPLALGAVIKSLGSLCWPPLFKGQNPLGSEANLVTAGENRPCARAFRSRCQPHRKRESQRKFIWSQHRFSPCRRLLATEETSVAFCLYRDNVGIRTRAVAVIGPQPIIILRKRCQPDNISSSRIADVQVLVPRYVIGKKTVCGHIQPVTSRPSYTVPVRSEAAGRDVGRL